MSEPKSSPSLRRRQWLSRAGHGLAGVALASLQSRFASRSLQASSADASGEQINASVKRIVWLFMHGGPSHIDLLDPKPQLERLAGQTLPESFGDVMTRRKVASNPLLPSIRKFKQHGQSGLALSDWLPETARCADDLCVIRSMHGDSVNHPQAVYQSNTGNVLMGKPSVGSWVSYGLGNENQDLPAFVVLPDPGGGNKGGPPAWGNGYLPATYQGVTMRPGESPILHLKPSLSMTSVKARQIIDLAQRLNRSHMELRDDDDELAARIASYEMAFRMQSAAPELVDLSNETRETKSLYGIDRPVCSEFGTRCLLARRMVERGVRFVQVYSGDTNGWDAHQDVESNHSRLCAATDRPVAGLLQDLKRRGLWHDTLVIWGGEFGRMPMSESKTGRDHNPWGYSIWLAGGAVRGGLAYGATDEVGLRAIDQPVHLRNFHATLLHLLGLDPEYLSYFHNGLNERLIGPAEGASIVRDILV